MAVARQPQLNLAQRIVLAGLLLCMALAQSLSVTHRTLHSDVRMLAHAYEEQHTGHPAHGADCDHGIFSRLFAGHESGDESCQLIDGSSSFSELFHPIAGVLPALYAHVLVASIAHARAAWQAPLFEARGPPMLSLQ
jgi:hypothetical protein